MGKRLTVLDWQCQGSGDCCRVPKFVAMTYAERKELEDRKGDALRPLTFRYNDHPRFTNMVTGPCPFVTDDNRCNVYDVRPHNCRRFGCARPDVAVEKFEDSPAGCLNLVERLPEAAPIIEAMQAEARPWALAHQWDERLDQ